MNIKDKVVIVTGASSGIGLATARLLASLGAKVALVARSKDKLENLSKEIPDSLPIRTDMTKEAEIIEMVKNMTLTDFEKNTIKDIEETEGELEEERGTLPPSDPPEHVARKILEGIENNEAEIFAHDWMKKSRQA